MTARLALTFDYYPEVVAARDIMWNYNITTATYYAWYPNILASGASTGDQIALSDVVLMKMIGWEIGAYTNYNMVSMINNNRNDANSFLRDLDNGMNAAGFEVETIAPNQRAWDARLANLARGRFAGVRVAANYVFQQYPVADPLYVNDGGANSWGVGQAGSDSPSAILARIDDLIATGGLAIEVIHKIGPVGDGLTFPAADFTTVMDGIASRVAAGSLQLVTMAQALQ